MYFSDIICSANREDEEPWRLVRIHRCIGYAQALADLDKNKDFHKKINSISDHKGVLTVVWQIEPTQEEKEYLQKAWESIVTDYEGNPIIHEIL